MGVSDSGDFLSRAVAGGALGGLAAAAWAVLFNGLRGLPWWAPLALYRTHLLGASPTAVVSHTLLDAVVAGIVRLCMVGLVGGALFGLLAGATVSHRLGRRQLTLIAAIFGIALYFLAHTGGIAVFSSAVRIHLPVWARALAAACGAAVSGWMAGGALPAEKARDGRM